MGGSSRRDGSTLELADRMMVCDADVASGSGRSCGIAGRKWDNAAVASISGIAGRQWDEGPAVEWHLRRLAIGL